MTLVVQVPTKLNSEQRELLKKFDEAMYGSGEDADSEAESEEGSRGKKRFGKKKK